MQTPRPPERSASLSDIFGEIVQPQHSFAALASGALEPKRFAGRDLASQYRRTQPESFPICLHSAPRGQIDREAARFEQRGKTEHGPL
jgi:hypothetical protein